MDTSTFRNNETELVEELVCTPGHPFYVDKLGWVEADKLVENDEFILYNNKATLISKETELLETSETTYNFEVEDYHTYYVGKDSILVHNKCAEAYLKEALEREGLDSVPETGFKTEWMEGKYKIEVRAHLGNLQYTNAKMIYRVSRHLNGSGVEYLGSNGIWYHTSMLKPTSQAYSAFAATVTHIPIN